jgi:hypothetical protein
VPVERVYPVSSTRGAELDPPHMREFDMVHFDRVGAGDDCLRSGGQIHDLDHFAAGECDPFDLKTCHWFFVL